MQIIHFSKIQRTYDELSTVLGLGDTVMNKTDQVPALKKRVFQWKETDKYRSKYRMCYKGSNTIDLKIKHSRGVENVDRREGRFAFYII